MHMDAFMRVMVACKQTAYCVILVQVIKAYSTDYSHMLWVGQCLGLGLDYTQITREALLKIRQINVTDLPQAIKPAFSQGCLAFTSCTRSEWNLMCDPAVTLLYSFILMHLDYCNSVLAGLPKLPNCQLQFVFYCGAEIMASMPKFLHGSHYMREVLHWLPVEDRITFKMLLFCWTAIGWCSYRICQGVVFSCIEPSLLTNTAMCSMWKHVGSALSPRDSFLCNGPSLCNSLSLKIRTCLMLLHRY